MNSKWTTNEIIYSSIRTNIFQATNQDGETYILKKTSNKSLSFSQKLKKEFSLLSEINSPNVIKAIAIESNEEETILVLENIKAMTLKEYLEDRKFKPGIFLDFAIQIVNGLKAIHSKNIVHKDINPSNILLKDGKITIIDFNIAEKITKKSQKIVKSLEGTLNYVSPEQTGKLKTSVDLRSDLYSLGITFYEMITGFVPFSNDDPEKTLHDHISKIAISPNSINKNIPRILSDIILKLIQKDPNDRYQSTIGLKHDLQRAQEILKKGLNQKIILGEKDVISQIGDDFIDFVSDTDIIKINKNFKKLQAGEEIFTFSPSFFIKRNSPLIQRIIDIATDKKILIIHSDINDSLSHFNNFILRDLIRQFYIYIKFKSRKVKPWIEKINQKIGNNFRIIIDLYPEFSDIIGNKPELPRLSTMEDKKRFFSTLKIFLSLFASENLPIVFIIKNFHLADTDLKELIDEILFKEKNSYLWVFYEYQKGAWTKLSETIEYLKQNKDKANLDIFKLNIIETDYIQKKLEKKFWLDRTESLIISKLMSNKTNGEPFFLNKFLKNMVEEKIIYFDYKKERWLYDLEKLNSYRVSENVVNDLINKLNLLDEKNKRILFVSACIGKLFNLKLVTKLCELEESEVKERLKYLVNNDFINYVTITNSENHYEFFHQDLYLKSYNLFNNEEKDKLNKFLFEYYIEKSKNNPNIENILNIVSNLNQINNPEIIDDFKNKIFKYNVLAGRESQKNLNYKKALDFYKRGLATILDEKLDEPKIRENINILIDVAELSYTNDDEKYLEKLIKIGVKNSKSNIEKVNFLEIKMRNEFSHNRMQESLQTGVKCANLLNFRLSKNSTKLTVITEFFKTKLYWSGFNKKRLTEIPESYDPTLIKLVKILLLMSVTAYIIKPNLLAILVFKMMRILPAECPKEGIHFFAGYGMILCGVFNDIENGYKMGNLAIKLIKKYNAKQDSGRTIFTTYSYVYPWKKHMIASLNPLLTSMDSMYKSEDFEYYSSALLTYIYLSFFVGKNLSNLIERVQYYNNILEKHNQAQFKIRNSMWGEFYANFNKRDNDYMLLNGDFFNETLLLPEIRKRNTETTIFDYSLIKMILGMFFYKYDEGYSYSAEAHNTLEARTGSILKAMYYFYDSLLLLNSSKIENSTIIAKVDKNLTKLKKWAELNPDNFLNKYLLIEAEKKRKMHKYLEAEEFFEKSIKQARKNSFVLEEALAKELLAKLYIEKGISKLALILLQEAVENYANWGAENKVKHIHELYKNFFASNISSSTTTITNLNPFNQSKQLKINDPILQTYQVIADEIKFENLLTKLMKIILLNSGANRVIILTKIKDQIYVNAESSVNEKEINIFKTTLVEDYNELSHMALNQVIFSNKYLLIDNLKNNEINYEDKYFVDRSIKSLLCLPILNNKVVQGYLYLENKFVNGVFTQEKLRLIEIIAAQLATFLNTALLYQNIEQSEEKYRTLVDNLKDGVYIIQKEKIQYVNKALLNILGLEKENVIGSYFADFISPKYQEMVKINYIKRLNNEMVDKEYEIELLHKNRETIPVILSSGIITYNDNIAIEGTIKDITELKLAREIQQHYNEKLEYQIAKKTKDIRYLLDNAVEGFLSINNNLRINKEFSKECLNIFGKNIANRDFVEIAFKDNGKNERRDIKELFHDIFNATDELSLDVYTSLLPEESKLNNKYLSFIYNYLDNNRLMIIITDITTKKNLELKMEIEKKNLRMIVKAITDSNLMKRSVNDYIKYFTVEIFDELNSNLPYQDILNIIFRKVHTFKGDLSQWDMTIVAENLAEVEDWISTIIANKDNYSLSDLAQKLKSFAFTDWINQEINIITERIGKNIFDEDDNLIIDKNAIFEIENYVIKHFSYNELVVLLPKIRRLRYINFKTLIFPYQHYVNRLAEKLGKLVNPLEITGDDILVDYDIYYNFSKTLVHLFRNMIDHGIESPEERLEKGLKSEIGNVKCNFTFSDSKEIIMEFSDDGAGIDFDLIRKKLIEKKRIPDIIEISEEILVDTIFDDGFTTNTKVSDVSGRGVGLSALKSEVLKLGGKISVSTKKGFGTTFKITIPFIEKNVREKIKIDLIMQAIEKSMIGYFKNEFNFGIKEISTEKMLECNVDLGEIVTFIDIAGMIKTRIIFSLSESKAINILKLQYPDAFEGEDLTELAKGNIAEILNIIIGNSLRSLEEKNIFISIGTPIIISGKNTNLSQSGQSMIVKNYQSKYGILQMIYEMDSMLF